MTPHRSQDTGHIQWTLIEAGGRWLIEAGNTGGNIITLKEKAWAPAEKVVEGAPAEKEGAWVDAEEKVEGKLNTNTAQKMMMKLKIE